MSSSPIRETANFGKPKKPSSIVIIRNGKTRNIKINPVFFSIGVCALIMGLVGYLGATSYLLFRDDVLKASISRYSNMQHEYEDRIAALRSKLDKITSRQLVDQQHIEARVQQLLARQNSINNQAGKMGSLLEKAKSRGLNIKQSALVPVPSKSPMKTSEAIDFTLTGSIDAMKPVKTASMNNGISFGKNDKANTAEEQPASNSMRLRYAQKTPEFSNQIGDDLFGNVASAIETIDSNQRHVVDSLTIAAAERSQKIIKILKNAGVKISSKTAENVGGPFTPLDPSADFALHLEALETTLNSYDKIKGLTYSLPFGSPVKGAKISSRYGSRVDPFNGKAAHHGGLDFKAKSGTPVRATGSGVVVKAGRLGGYGKLVEIKHASGLTTRYAHLSRITVKKGQKVYAGERIGKVGSTGRSTGPHLHYEVRRSNKTRNPAHYLNTGYKLRGLL